MYIYIYAIIIHTCVVCVCSCIHTQVCLFDCVRMYVCMLDNILSEAYTYIHAYTRTHINPSCIYAGCNQSKHVCPYIRSYIHAYMHTCVQVVGTLRGERIIKVCCGLDHTVLLAETPDRYAHVCCVCVCVCIYIYIYICI
jgi:hypothetical protein